MSAPPSDPTRPLADACVAVPSGARWTGGHAALVFAAAAYLLAMANLAYLIGFITDLGVPKSIADGSMPDHPWRAVAVDTLLVLGFGLHHSITARRRFKRWWADWVPNDLERPVYLCMTAAACTVLVIGWQPIPLTVWRLEQAWAVTLIHAANLAIWLMMFAATFHFGHLQFFGVAPAIARLLGRTPAPSSFTARHLYALVRHPISLGWMLVPWVVPHLTAGHVVFGLATAAYVLCATVFEEADLMAEFGQRYRVYREHVPAFLPWWRR
jgi:protein-S-isoprenylcysteine O-methyltransferase Ste14